MFKPATIAGYTHVFKPASSGDFTQSPTILLLHGTGGDENDLLFIERYLGSNYNYLSPKGKVDENGMGRFFRRHAHGILDLEDLDFRTKEICLFIHEAALAYDLHPDRFIALGYSNGANMAASLLLKDTGMLKHAVLLHPMLPFTPDRKPDLKGCNILISAGENDPIIPFQNTLELQKILDACGAETLLIKHQQGHQLLQMEINEAAAFINKLRF